MRHLSLNVAGCKAYREQGHAALRELEQATTAYTMRLEPEPSNMHDKYAIKVLINTFISSCWHHVGYVPEEDRRTHQKLSQFVSQLLSMSLVESVELESYGRLKKDPSIPRFRIRISHHPLVPGKRDSKAMTEGYSVRIGAMQTEAELRKVGENIAQCHRIRIEDRQLLRRLYAEQLAKVRKERTTPCQ